MARNRTGRASWFKVFLSQKALIDAVPDENAGAALKAALGYFDTGKAPEGLEPLTFAVFSSLKPYIDEAFSDYQEASEKNRQNVNKRWGKKGIRGDTSGNDSLPNDTEAEAEAEAETEVETNALSRANNGSATSNQPPPSRKRSAKSARAQDEKCEPDFNHKRNAAIAALRNYPG